MARYRSRTGWECEAEQFNQTPEQAERLELDLLRGPFRPILGSWILTGLDTRRRVCGNAMFLDRYEEVPKDEPTG